MKEINSVCVFCGSSSAVAEGYKEAANALGQTFAKQGIRLVYGGGQVGIMGITADAVLQNGGEVTGIIPEFLHALEIAKLDLTELVRVDTMHTRKQLMAERSDAFVVLPGGYGTLEELFEVLTWRQLNLHNKPIIILNTDGFWTPLVSMIDHIIDQGFARSENRALLTIVDEVEQVVPAILAGVESGSKNAPQSATDLKMKWT